MSSTFNGQGLFNSGPHRFEVGASGSQLLANSRLNPVSPGNTSIGALERTIVVRGRLVAADDSELNTQLASIAGQISSPPTRGMLVDHWGRGYEDMDFVLFTPGDRVDRGRQVSMAFEARFVQLTGG